MCAEKGLLRKISNSIISEAIVERLQGEATLRENIVLSVKINFVRTAIEVVRDYQYCCKKRLSHLEFNVEIEGTLSVDSLRQLMELVLWFQRVLIFFQCHHLTFPPQATRDCIK